VKNQVLLAAIGTFIGTANLVAAQTTPPQQATAPDQRSLPPIPGLGPAPVLPPNATPAQQADYKRQMAERICTRWNYLLTDSLARTRIFNTAPNALLAETVRGRPARPSMPIWAKAATPFTWRSLAGASRVST
jgi:hypothetical protein